MMLFQRKKMQMVSAQNALAGRADPIATAATHFVSGRDLTMDVPTGMEVVQFGMGCFWGVERIFWQLEGVWLTMVGYAAGHTPNATYDEVCTGKTGHNEVVRVVYDPAVISFQELLVAFWEGHDPTQGMRQGNDLGTQYRSGIYCSTEAQMVAALQSKSAYQERLDAAGFPAVTTEILEAPTFYFAEDYHQQYLAKNPAGYCGIGGTGVSCPAGLDA
ncbi:peptide-methionine (S)-S-oxide reductase MsrA [Nereida ignava]|uniref:Peptide methionine sulfoxide reductase MsrA n=1 Tax=Nereida ignava TaxID=282199 RepID=A0A0U1NJI8_9RHOB|nr:peptide-methionine (S)-S-oxide reductase MsrA [Nereida ignava]CRK74881.1 Peptide methionine sulfoxide reductase MsrA [Nereida ignava]SFJ63647.1 peptide-methionine (S)-S-oxide reductase [Nereida ignava DSM 16309]